MSRASKIAMFLGIAVQAATIGAFLICVRPLTVMALVCLCFILFAELELFGSISLMSHYVDNGLQPAIRMGISIASGVYSCFAVVTALAFLPYDFSYVRGLFFLQILLLVAMVAADMIVVAVVRKR